MTDRKTPETMADDDLDAVQGAGKVRQSDSKIVMHEEQETVFMDPRKQTGKVILSSEGVEPSKGIVLSSETEEPAFKKG